MGAYVSVPMYRRALPQRLRLEGRRCTACGVIQFPPLGACPRCGGCDLHRHDLSGRGVVEAVTMIAPVGAPPEFAGLGAYDVAIVRLAEGPAVTAMLTGSASIGDPVEMVVRRLYEQEGVVRYGFKFRPLEAQT